MKGREYRQGLAIAQRVKSTALMKQHPDDVEWMKSDAYVLWRKEHERRESRFGFIMGAGILLMVGTVLYVGCAP